jgi:hypothetical protein
MKIWEVKMGQEAERDTIVVVGREIREGQKRKDPRYVEFLEEARIENDRLLKARVQNGLKRRGEGRQDASGAWEPGTSSGDGL